MAIFNQQGQTVGYQFNGDMFHFDSARSVPAALAELEKLLSELSEASASNLADVNAAAQAQTKVAEAVAAARGPNPEKSKIASYLTDAASLLQSVASLSGLAGAAANAAAMVWRLF
jgi:hypothetical protein